MGRVACHQLVLLTCWNPAVPIPWAGYKPTFQVAPATGVSLILDQKTDVGILKYLFFFSTTSVSSSLTLIYFAVFLLLFFFFKRPFEYCLRKEFSLCKRAAFLESGVNKLDLPVQVSSCGAKSLGSSPAPSPSAPLASHGTIS